MNKEEVEAMLETPIISVIPEDIAVPRSISKKTPVVQSRPTAKSSREFRRLAANIVGSDFVEKYGTWIERMFGWMM